MAYLGNLGGLVQLKCVTSLATDSTRPARTQTSLGGTVSLQVGARTNRVWNAAFSDASTPDQIGAVQAFIEGEYGLGPWWYVSDWALKTNVISPRGSVLDLGVPPSGVSPEGGPMALPGGGIAGRSLLVTPSSTLVVLPHVDGALEYIPVMPGHRVTASAYVMGVGARLRIRFYGPTGSVISTVGDAIASGSAPERLALSATPPVGAASMLLLIDKASRIARPAVTWTDSLRPWSSGQGAPSVHLSEISTDVVLATDERQYASASFQIVEVG